MKEKMAKKKEEMDKKKAKKDAAEAEMRELQRLFEADPKKLTSKQKM